MTGAQLWTAIWTLTILYLILVIVGVAILGQLYGTSTTLEGVQDAYLKVAAFTLPPIAAVFAYFTQKRSAYVQQLRSVCQRAITNVEAAIYLTENTAAIEKDWLEVRENLSCTLEEIRTVYRNVHDQKGNVGLFPFEIAQDDSAQGRKSRAASPKGRNLITTP